MVISIVIRQTDSALQNFSVSYSRIAIFLILEQGELGRSIAELKSVNSN